MYIWTSICKTSLLYGCNALYLKKTDLNDIEKLQAKLVKCIFGVKLFYKSRKLLQALKLNKCINLIECDNISLLNRIMNSNSAACEFYLYVLKKNVTCKTLLYNRVRDICSKYNVNFYKCILDHDYFMSVKRSILKPTKHGECGIVDTLRQLLYNNHNYDENLRLLKLILKPF